MNRRKILILGAGVEQITAIKQAQELDVYVIALDSNPRAEALNMADKSYVADIKNVKEVAKIGRDNRVNGVMTHGVEVGNIVAAVASRLHLPGLNPHVAETTTNKLKRITCLSKKNIPTPRFAVANNLYEAKTQSRMVGFPLVMKPTDSSGAKGVSKVSSIKKIDRGYQYALAFSGHHQVILEEFIKGREISTEALIINGKIYHTGFADRNYYQNHRFEPYFIEDGHTIPSTLAKKTRQKVLKVIEKAIYALGLNWGVAKGDIIIEKEQPKVLELVPRTSGGRFAADMVPLSSGVNIIKPLIQMSLGLKIEMSYLKPKFKGAAAQRFFLPKAGKIKLITGLEDAKRIPGVYDIYLKKEVKPGWTIPPLRNHTDRIGHVIACAETRKKALSIAEEAVKTVRFLTK